MNVSKPSLLKERRTQRRELCSELVEIDFEDQRGSTMTGKGLIEDVSVDCLCVSLSLPLSPGAHVRVLADGFYGCAKVRHCAVREDDYLVGLELDVGSKWDPLAWRPGHLLTIPPEDA